MPRPVRRAPRSAPGRGGRLFRRLGALLRAGRRLTASDTSTLRADLKELGVALGAVRDLDVLVEVHDEEELQAALDVEAEVIGINNRDLGNFSVDIERTYELLSDVPAGKTVVSESGFSTREQLDELDRVGVDAVLIGETLMRAPDIEAACRELTGGVAL